MSLPSSNRRNISSLPCLESLEQRLLLSTLIGGDVFEYFTAGGQTVRVSLDGDIIAEFIAADLDPSNNPILGDIPGRIYESTTGRAGADILGGVGGGDGVEPLQVSAEQHKDRQDAGGQLRDYRVSARTDEDVSERAEHDASGERDDYQRTQKRSLPTLAEKGVSQTGQQPRAEGHDPRVLTTHSPYIPARMSRRATRRAPRSCCIPSARRMRSRRRLKTPSSSVWELF